MQISHFLCLLNFQKRKKMKHMYGSIELNNPNGIEMTEQIL